MIVGVGSDIIEIERIEKAVNRTTNFLEKLFTENEIELFKLKGMRIETIAGNFAAKEAISKAIGTGVRGFSMLDIEVLRDDLGKPVVNISEKIKNIISLNEFVFHISISHNNSSAIAFAVLEQKK